ncbi:MAG: hypothetical protein LBV74_10380 [Tannerella sp.]|nr:hypothetical protein [Tannerella sp.]
MENKKIIEIKKGAKQLPNNQSLWQVQVTHQTHRKLRNTTNDRPRVMSRSVSGDSVKNLCCLSKASYIDFSCRNVRLNERSTRSLAFLVLF